METIINFDYISILSELFNNITLEWFLKLIIIYFFIVWISIIIWVIRDIINRTNNIFFQIIAILIPILLTPFWLIIYLLIRPSQTLFEKDFIEDSTQNHNNIEILNEKEKHFCYNCNFEVKQDYVYCPNCKEKLKHSCKSCKKEISSNFKNCPYCWTSQEESKKQEIIREKDETKVLVFKDNEEKIYKMNDLLTELKVDWIIRIEEKDFDMIKNDLFWHFNIEKSWHIVWKKYALMKILKKWYYDDDKKEEKLPLLSYEDIKIYECIEVKNNINYDKIEDSMFENSLDNIKDIESLKEAIIRRYSISLPHLSSKQLIQLWVWYTLLKKEKEVIE